MAGAAPLIVYGLGLGVTAVGKVMEMNAASEAAEQQYALDMAQADELLERQEINEQLLTKKAEEMSVYGTYLSGSKGGQNTGIGVRLKMYENLQQTLQTTRREALFKAKMIRAGAEVDKELASSAKISTALGLAGLGIRGAYGAYRGMDRPSDTARDLAVARENAVVPGAFFPDELDF